MNLIVTVVTCGQSLESKLSQEALFVPQSNSALEQLLEIAKYYRIPMGIEWVYQPDAQRSNIPQETRMKVQDLVNAILQQSPGYQAEIRDGVLHVARPELVSNPQNFLALRISDFAMEHGNLFAATAALRLKIHMRLHPERYAKGFNGGYGYGVPREDGFDVNNITFVGHNLTVREILNKIAAANGNALWAVELIPSKGMRNEPFFAQGRLFDQTGQPAQDFYWQFIPLQGEP
jgi:hypothetical protein